MSCRCVRKIFWIEIVSMMRALSEALGNMLEKDGPVRMNKKNLHFAFFLCKWKHDKIWRNTTYIRARLCVHFHKVGIYLSSNVLHVLAAAKCLVASPCVFFTWGRGKRGECF